ncbi:COMM domain-containing protein 3-like [Clavelina lepadiformis]|uniref:COMM domain-containing protein 3 n=1 Tax=Clavelina lepadiformis TaxID=159417 RepID=A0ABP0FX83_CLALP
MDFLSQQSLSGLRLCGDSSVIPDKLFDRYVEHICKVITDPEKAGQVPDNFTSLSSSALKQSHAALSALVVESAKHDVDDDQLGMILDECNFSTTKRESFIATFNHFKQDLRNHLFNIGVQPPHIVDIGWRLDYNVKTNHTHKVNELRYTVSLKQNNGEMTDFTCTREELQDLVGKLKEAAKAVERASQV